MAVDLNDGYTIKLHPSGFRVLMMKSRPGVYVDSSGNALTDAVAKAAGFDTDRMAKERMKGERLAEARARIEREFQEKEAEFEALINASVDGSRFQVKHIGAGKYAITDQDGNRVTTKAMDKDEAETLLADMSDPPDTPTIPTIPTEEHDHGEAA